MLSTYLENIKSKHIILGSSSGARKRFLTMTGINAEVYPSEFPEDLDKNLFEHPVDYVIKTSEHKMLDCVARLKAEKKKVDILICGDSIKVKDGVIYEKPMDEQDAFNMLMAYSGNKHECFSSVWIVFLDDNYEFVKKENLVERTEITFSKTDEKTIWGYVKSGKPFNRAGGYGIEDEGATFIEKIDGDFYNVWGFPMNAFCKKFITMIDKSSTE